MPNIDIGSLVTVIVSLFGGGVVGVVIKSFTEKKKIDAEADNTNIKSILEIDQRMNERMAKLEERVANLEQENYKLSMEKLNLEKENHRLETEIKLLHEQIETLTKENKELKQELKKLQNKEGKNGPNIRNE